MTGYSVVVSSWSRGCKTVWLSEALLVIRLLTVEIPEGWEVHTRKNPIFGPNFFYSLLRPKKSQNRNKKKKFAQQIFARARPQIS
jgi:hypothetical protein